MTTRKEQIEKAAKLYEGLVPGAFVNGAEWADNNLDPGITELLSRIPKALTKILALEAKLAIAVEALKYIGNSMPGPDQHFELENKNSAIQALAKIKETE